MVVEISLGEEPAFARGRATTVALSREAGRAQEAQPQLVPVSFVYREIIPLVTGKLSLFEKMQQGHGVL